MRLPLAYHTKNGERLNTHVMFTLSAHDVAAALCLNLGFDPASQYDPGEIHGMLRTSIWDNGADLTMRWLTVSRESGYTEAEALYRYQQALRFAISVYKFSQERRE